MHKHSFFDRDLSWLSFNERVLMEASKPSVPLLERVKFLSIYSSNLDEFYRVRMPALLALHKLYKKEDIQKNEKLQYPDMALQAKEIIQKQLDSFGNILRNQILSALKEAGVHLLYKEALPQIIKHYTTEYFFSEILSFIQIVNLSQPGHDFFS